MQTTILDLLAHAKLRKTGNGHPMNKRNNYKRICSSTSARATLQSGLSCTFLLILTGQGMTLKAGNHSGKALKIHTGHGTIVELNYVEFD